MWSDAQMKYNISPKEVYECLIISDDILNIYARIEKYENEVSFGAFHNYEHVKNVSMIAEKILKDLNFDDNTIYKCKIACLLHDVGALEGKEGHAERSYVYAKELFEKNDWVFEGIEDVLDAIKNHSAGFDTDKIITLSIILADKLDIKKTRISEEGLKLEGNRQYGHIEDITINIENNSLIINFKTDGKINLEEINNYYFTKKVFKAIDSFSNKLGLKYSILMDEKIWNI